MTVKVVKDKYGPPAPLPHKIKLPDRRIQVEYFEPKTQKAPPWYIHYGHGVVRIRADLEYGEKRIAVMAVCMSLASEIGAVPTGLVWILSHNKGLSKYLTWGGMNESGGSREGASAS